MEFRKDKETDVDSNCIKEIIPSFIEDNNGVVDI